VKLRCGTGTAFVLHALAFRTEKGEYMARVEDGQIVETAREARQAEPGPTVRNVLVVSTSVSIAILAVIWFVFFRT
jgi:hypothetical protein